MVTSALMQPAGTLPGATTAHSPLWERISSSPMAWVAAGLLLVVAVVYLIRLLEWDQVNAAAENQEDPLLPRQ